MLIIIIFSILFAFIDQLSKYVIINYLDKEIVVIKNFLYLVYTKNDGAAFNIFSGERFFISIITIVIIILLIRYIKKRKNFSKIQKLAFSFIIGGALGNLIDRIIRGYVIDFISIKIITYKFPVFNIADSLICIGMCLLLFIELRGVVSICRLLKSK